MRFRPKPYLCLDFIHCANVVSLLAVLVYLLVVSIQCKLDDDDSSSEGIPRNQNGKHDWTGLDQYLIEFSQFFLTIFGTTAAVYFRSRQLLSIAILLYLANLIQLILIEASDCRNFPASVLRTEGYSLARYAILYTNKSTTSLVLKIILLILYLLNYLSLIVYFVVLRYQYIDKRTTRTAFALSLLHNNISSSSKPLAGSRASKGGSSSSGTADHDDHGPQAPKTVATTTTDAVPAPAKHPQQSPAKSERKSKRKAQPAATTNKHTSPQQEAAKPAATAAS